MQRHRAHSASGAARADDDTRRIRLPSELHDRLAALAKRDRRSVNGEIVHLLEVALADRPESAGSP
ncbi:Arc family DNA-binding protein [Streptomyces sp. NPDC015532]|uniref:Arc family DNA-binding protein n=1 Tax=Streptomyces sp. NPDC015532 TaxID=3364960 RepID=UPI0036F8817A